MGSSLFTSSLQDERGWGEKEAEEQEEQEEGTEKEGRTEQLPGR